MFRGVADLISGFRLLWQDRKLRALLGRMVGLLALLMVVAAMGGFYLLDHWAHAWTPDGEHWYGEMLTGLIWLLALLLGVLMALLVYVALASAVVAPWLESVALRAAWLRGQPWPEVGARSGLRMVLQAVGYSLRPLLGLAICGGLALLVWWIPFIGPVLAAVIWSYGSWRYLCFELMDTHASLLGWGFEQRRDALRRYRWYWIGFGGVAALMLIVPVLNLLLLPAAVAGLGQDGLGEKHWRDDTGTPMLREEAA